jgi:hypothetical protein
MRSRSDDYRFNALNCLALAEQITGPGAKALFIAMARSWYTLADQADRNSKLDTCFTRLLQSEPQQPVTQQQQQIQPSKDQSEE